jgi:hypothetical protein
MPVKFKDRHQLDPALADYLAKPAPHCLEIGAGWNGRPGWLATDLSPPPGLACIRLDATKSFEVPSESFDFVYSEHMIDMKVGKFCVFAGGIPRLQDLIGAMLDETPRGSTRFGWCTVGADH